MTTGAAAPTPEAGGDDPVLYQVQERVATITLNRPDRRNAISWPMLHALGTLLTRADADRDVRVVLLTGAGKGFCSGLDLKDAMSGAGIGGSSGGGGGILHTRDLPTVVLHQMDTPVIGVINGAAAGYGLDLALGCDIRLMSTAATLKPGFAKLGVVPESGGTWYLPRLLGWARAAEIGFLGDDLDAEAAARLGLVNRAVPPDELDDIANTWANKIASNAPLALRAMKRLFRHGLLQDFESHSHHVLLQTVQLFGTNDFREGLAAVVERREPEFHGR